MAKMRDIKVVILAAGRGLRMKSPLPKVLHRVCGKEMISIAIDTVKKAGFKDIHLVLGFKKDLIKKHIPKGIRSSFQKPPRGTAHALMVSQKAWRESKHLLMLYSDHPLLRPETIRRLANHHLRRDADLTLLIAHLDDPGDYGRILRDENGRISSIVEKINASYKELKIKEVNPGLMCFKTDILRHLLPKIKINKKKKEYYVTDIVSLLYKERGKIEELSSEFPEREGLGVNSPGDLIRAQEFKRQEIIEYFLSQGVRITWPQTVLIEEEVSIGENTEILPFTLIERGVKIGKNCLIGPFSHLRRGTIIGDNVEVGNFVEISRTSVDKFTKTKHFCYLGDASIGKYVNIGAGTVTANFDGFKKYPTIIGDKAFIGSDTILVAPLRIGKSARTGAGSVVLKKRDVEAGKTVVGVPAKVLEK